MKVIPIRKLAITMNGSSDNKTAEAIRVDRDTDKGKRFPTIDILYSNSPAYNKATMKEMLKDEIFAAGSAILSHERVQEEVRKKKK